MQDRYLQAKALAMEALELAPDAREAWLVQRCAGDAELRAEVDWLMDAARTGPDDPLAPGWLQAGTASLQEGSRVDAAQPGQYRILRLLGEGGMGVVYLAERDDGDARQQVALKLLASAGPHGARLAQRMAEERRILATLQHPNIAHLLDGGVTGDGQPFIALEYVEGERIDRWCQARQLPLRGRVELFLKVCAAVEHAHQRLVVHRDLKPANILVTPQGEPKLLDFGIARLIEAHAPAEPTGTAHRALTLAYASPEHVAGKPLTTATDVWSLGIVLYELLAGTRPHQAMESGHLLPDAIVSGEIRPPSSAPHTGNAHTDRSARTVSHAVGRIPADIDAIVLKALRHAPEDRYPSVAALSEDLRRFLQSRPVSARPCLVPAAPLRLAPALAARGGIGAAAVGRRLPVRTRAPAAAGDRGAQQGTGACRFHDRAVRQCRPFAFARRTDHRARSAGPRRSRPARAYRPVTRGPCRPAHGHGRGQPRPGAGFRCRATVPGGTGAEAPDRHAPGTGKHADEAGACLRAAGAQRRCHSHPSRGAGGPFAGRSGAVTRACPPPRARAAQ